jgi:2'-5' RNA ligase
MYGLVSVLPQPYFSQVESLWDELEANFNLSGIRITPIPHFSWQVAESYPEEAMLNALKAIAEEIKPFEVRVKGIDIFISQHPVVFLKVLKDTNLIKLHLKIWMKFLPIAKDANFLYSPPLWRPHISLTYQDLAWNSLKEILTYLKAKQIDWQLPVGNLAYVCQAGDEVGKLKYQVQLKG